MDQFKAFYLISVEVAEIAQSIFRYEYEVSALEDILKLIRLLPMRRKLVKCIDGDGILIIQKSL